MEGEKYDMKSLNKELHKCVLCYDAPCSKMYKNINPERIIRAIRFDNIKGAYKLIEDKSKCMELNDNSKEKCPLNVDINNILKNVIKMDYKNDDLADMDISSEICGVKIENPFLLSSSVVGSQYEMCKRALKQGWAGVAIKTISLMNMYESSPRFSALKDWDDTFMRI